MVLLLYTDASCEYQAIGCLRSLEPYLPDDMKILYFTIGFDSTFEMRNLQTIRVPYNPVYPTFHYYKAELSLKALDVYPDEQYFFFTDTDILFSPRIDFQKLKCEEDYPLGVFGPHEYPFIWHKPTPDSELIIYNETALMQYLNVPKRSIRYQWSCFYSFNRNCRDFLQEFTALCQYSYLLHHKEIYYPFHDETSFNVLLWKRNATKSSGFVWVNTHNLEVIKKVEETEIKGKQLGMNIDICGADWEYVDDSKNVMFYHGTKTQEDIQNNLDYLLSLNKPKSDSVTWYDSIHINRLQSLLKEMRVSFFDSCDGVNELYGLQDLIVEHLHPNASIVEIGSFEGKSTELLAIYCDNVYSIDPYQPYPGLGNLEQAENMFTTMQRNYPNVVKIRKTSLEAVDGFENESLDAVYIDGAHDYDNVKADIIAWTPKVKQGGIVCGHDYNFREKGIRTAVTEMFPRQKVYLYKDSSWAIVKT